ncbi:hypothetical protein LG943_21345 [Streptomonospora sp. S1-112]|uniref:Uncharacterized protein n=1 Tax=Streptomonospora mangrovi TaxID=2883123 RepID=A0A9X3NN72_9ACTN|nr:DUF6585 family protein [Streptomonospora mangrovi]MDA0566839.1 hypothetical protein [Streptomonospora mangrovi]
MVGAASPREPGEQDDHDPVLGRRIAVFRPVRPSPVVPVIVAAAALVFGGIILYLLIVSGLIASIFGIVLIGAGVVVLGFSVAGMWMTANDYRSGKELRVYEHGAVVRPRGDMPLTFRWADTRLLVSVVRRTSVYTYAYALLGSGNRPVVMGQNIMLVNVLSNTEGDSDYGDLLTAPFFERIDVWGPMLEEGVTRAHLPRVRAELTAGRAVEFGPVTVSPEGLTVDRTQIPWGEVAGITIDNGYLHIKRTGHLFRTSQPVSHIPNFLVLVAVVREFTGTSLT